ncbi:MAG: hypothetical protein KF777_20875 [Planctomycetaceae bacterium]|nr:hypothetical protein [Planctomycetaceae bacterium]
MRGHLLSILAGAVVSLPDERRGDVPDGTDRCAECSTPMQLAAGMAAWGYLMSRPKFLTLLGLLVLVGSLSGCASFWYDLKPHRLHRMNRGDPPSLDPEFSATPPSTENVRFWT